MDNRIIDFFKEMGFYDEKYFNMIKSNTLVVDKDYEEIYDLVGFYKEIFKLVLPKIKNERDLLLYVHEYSHALFPEDNSEIFPNLMEAYFINKYFDIDTKNYLKKITLKEIELSNDLEHTNAKKLKLELIK